MAYFLCILISLVVGFAFGTLYGKTVQVKLEADVKAAEAKAAADAKKALDSIKNKL